MIHGPTIKTHRRRQWLLGRIATRLLASLDSNQGEDDTAVDWTRDDSSRRRAWTSMVFQEASLRWSRVKDSRSSTNNKRWSIATCTACRILWCLSRLSVNILLAISRTSRRWARCTHMIKTFCCSTRLNKHIKQLCSRVWPANSRVSLLRITRLKTEECKECNDSLQPCSGIRFLEPLSLASPPRIHNKTTWCSRTWDSHHS